MTIESICKEVTPEVLVGFVARVLSIVVGIYIAAIFAVRRIDKTSRQKYTMEWINDIRDVVSEYSGVMRSYIISSNQLSNLLDNAETKKYLLDEMHKYELEWVTLDSKLSLYLDNRNTFQSNLQTWMELYPTKLH